MKGQKISVTFFLPSLEPGGTEKNVVNLVNTIDREKYQVSLVLGSMKGDFMAQIKKDVPIINLHASYSLGLFFTLMRYFKTQKPDIFVSAFPRINIISIVAKICSLSNVKIIITEHSVFSFLPVIAKTPIRRLFARFFMPTLARALYPKTDAILCVSKGIADDLSQILHSTKKIRVIYNPVINDNISLLANEPVDHPWFLDKHIPIIIAVGRLVECKDYPALLKAFAKVVEKQPARLVILGRGPEEKKLKQLSEDLGITRQVAFLGFVENPYKYMKKASMLALTSLQEGFGNVIIEAMACEIPVVSTDCPTGPGEIITHGKNGILVPLSNESALAEAITQVLQNASLRESLSREGKKRSQDFLILHSMQKYQNVFEELVSHA